MCFKEWRFAGRVAREWLKRARFFAGRMLNQFAESLVREELMKRGFTIAQKVACHSDR